MVAGGPGEVGEGKTGLQLRTPVPLKDLLMLFRQGNRMFVQLHNGHDPSVLSDFWIIIKT